MLTKLWAFLNTDIQDLKLNQAVEITKTGTDAAKAVFDLAKTVKEQQPKVETLKPYIGEISSLLDVLNAPFAQIVKDAIPFAPLAITVLQTGFLVSIVTRNPVWSSVWRWSVRWPTWKVCR